MAGKAPGLPPKTVTASEMKARYQERMETESMKAVGVPGRRNSADSTQTFGSQVSRKSTPSAKPKARRRRPSKKALEAGAAQQTSASAIAAAAASGSSGTPKKASVSSTSTSNQPHRYAAVAASAPKPVPVPPVPAAPEPEDAPSRRSMQIRKDSDSSASDGSRSHSRSRSRSSGGGRGRAPIDKAEAAAAAAAEAVKAGLSAADVVAAAMQRAASVSATNAANDGGAANSNPVIAGVPLLGAVGANESDGEDSSDDDTAVGNELFNKDTFFFYKPRGTRSASGAGEFRNVNDLDHHYRTIDEGESAYGSGASDAIARVKASAVPVGQQQKQDMTPAAEAVRTTMADGPATQLSRTQSAVSTVSENDVLDPHDEPAVRRADPGKAGRIQFTPDGVKRLLGTPDIQGYMLQRMGAKKWKKRYFVLRRNLLTTFMSQSSTKTSGMLMLDDCEVTLPDIADRDFVFAIKHKRLPTLELQAPNEATKRRWMDELRSNIDNAPKVSLAGYLTKQGGTYKTWKRRLVVLSGDMLFYYKPQETFQVQGFVLLCQAKIEPAQPYTKRKYSFRVAHPERRTWFMVCDGEDEMHQWIDALTAAASGN